MVAKQNIAFKMQFVLGTGHVGKIQSKLHYRPAHNPVQKVLWCPQFTADGLNAFWKEAAEYKDPALITTDVRKFIFASTWL